MSGQTVVIGVFKDGLSAAQALAVLRDHGVRDEETSVIAPDTADLGTLGIERHSRAAEGMALGGGLGAATGAVLAGFTAVGAVATGGVGLLAVGPLVAALVGAGAGATAGGVLGGLIGLGIPENTVKLYADELHKGSMLIGARVSNERASEIKKVMEEAGASNVATQASKQAAEMEHKNVSTDTWAGENALRKLFIEQLMDLNYAEKKLVDALEQLEEKAHDPALANAFASHRIETQRHKERIADIFELLGVKADEKKCPAINGIIAEAKELMKLDEGMERDAALICAAQKAEHYEIGSYGCLRTYAQTLGLHLPARILEHTLQEEHEADRKLTELAVAGINRAAVPVGAA